MQRVNIRELADAMMRLHGKPQALTLAQQYAADAAAMDDHPSRIRWSRVAAVLGEMMALERRFG